jgi:hypothetical protein
MKKLVTMMFAAAAVSTLSAKTLVWWTMQNDAANNGSNIVAETTFTNIASAANELYGKIGPGSMYSANYNPTYFILPVPTNGFESPYLLQDGVCGVPAANDFAVTIESDPDKTSDNWYGCSLYSYDPEGKLNLQSFTIEFFFRTKKWTNWHGLLVKPFWNDTTSGRTNTFAVYENSYSRTRTSLNLQYTYLDNEGVATKASTVNIYSGSSPCIQDGEWHHIAFTLDQATHKFCLYIDGSLKNTQTLLGDIAYSSDFTKYWHIGGDPKGDWAWGGTIDEVRFHDRALSADELLRRTASVPSITEWTANGSGEFGTAANWSAGVPSASVEGHILEDTASPFTVSVSSPTSLAGTLLMRNTESATTLSIGAPFLLASANLSFFEGSAVHVGAGGSITVADSALSLNGGSSLSAAQGSEIVFNNAVFTQTVGADSALTGSVAATGSSFTLNGGSMVFAGNTVMTNSTFTAYRPVTIPSGTSFLFTNNVDNALTFGSGGVLDLKGNLSISTSTGSGCPVAFKRGSSFLASGNASFMAETAAKQGRFYFRGSNMEFRDNAVITNYHAYFSVEAAGATNRIVFRDSSRMVMTGDGSMMIGYDNRENALTVFDYASSKDISFPYGVTVARGQNAELNITGGARMLGTGNPNAVGYAAGDRAVTGVVNVVKGALVRNNGSQYAKWLYGTSVGDSMDRPLSYTKAFGRGYLNIFPDGVVSNLGGSAYLRIGTSRGEGDINQLGGTLYHSGIYQAVLGLWGGIGRWTLSSNSTATVLSDVYVGGSLTNVLRGFVEGKNNGYHADFIMTFDVENHTAKGTLSVLSGTFYTPSNIFVSVDGEGSLVLGPDKASSMLAKGVVLSNTVDSVNDTTYRSTLKFVFGPDGCARLVCGGKVGGVPQPTGRLVVGEGSKLEIDLTDLTDKRTSWYPLVNCAEIEGDFSSADVSVTPPASGNGGGSLVRGVHNDVNGYWWVVPRGTLLMFK